MIAYYGSLAAPQVYAVWSHFHQSLRGNGHAWAGWLEFGAALRGLAAATGSHRHEDGSPWLKGPLPPAQGHLPFDRIYGDRPRARTGFPPTSTIPWSTRSTRAHQRAVSLIPLISFLKLGQKAPRARSARRVSAFTTKLLVTATRYQLLAMDRAGAGEKGETVNNQLVGRRVRVPGGFPAITPKPLYRLRSTASK